MPNLLIEEDFGWPDKSIAGVDEAGRGPWAGPVVSAAVVLNKKNIPSDLDDSKKVSEKRRQSLYSSIHDSHFVGVGISSIEEIDNLNILQASLLSMKRAIDKLNVKPELVLIDGNFAPKGIENFKTIINGDEKIKSISAASIIAKVYRDQLMIKLSERFHNYAWERNFGYGTKAHMEGLKKFGITSHHRKGFKPIHKMLSS